MSFSKKQIKKELKGLRKHAKAVMERCTTFATEYAPDSHMLQGAAIWQKHQAMCMENPDHVSIVYFQKKFYVCNREDQQNMNVNGVVNMAAARKRRWLKVWYDEVVDKPLAAGINCFVCQSIKQSNRQCQQCF